MVGGGGTCGSQGRLPLSCPTGLESALSLTAPSLAPSASRLKSQPTQRVLPHAAFGLSPPFCVAALLPFIFLFMERSQEPNGTYFSNLCVLGRHLCWLEAVLLGTELLPLLVAFHIRSVGTVHLPSRGLEREDALNAGWWVQALLLAEPPPWCWRARGCAPSISPRRSTSSARRAACSCSTEVSDVLAASACETR